jgi:hypothetical protein
MQPKAKIIKTIQSTNNVTIAGSYNAKINYNSPGVKKRLDVVKQEVKTVQESANVDTQKLSLNFTV